VESRFQSAWANRTPVDYLNVPFAQPASGAWVRLGLAGSIGGQIGLGPPGFRLERHDGLVVVQAFVPVTSGTAVLAGHLDFAAAIFRMVSFRSPEGLDFVFRSSSNGPAILTSSTLMQNVSVPFQVDALQ